MDKEYIENRMKELETEFTTLEQKSQKVANDYNSRLANLQAEGKAELEKIKDRREQVRGEYTALSYIIHPELRPKEQPTQEFIPTEEPPIETESVEQPQKRGPAPVDNVLEMSEVAPKQEEAQSTTLSPEELAKVKQVTAKPQPKKDEKDDTPDYLKG